MGVTTSTANAGATYTPIATTTLGSAQSSVTFSSISGYTDLIVEITGLQSSSSVLDFAVRYNSDSGTNYSNTDIAGDGSSASSGRNANHTQAKLVYFGSTSWVGTVRLNIQSYSNPNVYKTGIARFDTPAAFTGADVTLWRSTAAVTSITFLMTSGNIAAGTFTVYGIKAA